MDDSNATLLDVTAAIVASYVANNKAATSELGALIESVHRALAGLGKSPEPEVPALVPAVPIKKSITPDYMISLEDGKKYKSLKRHLRTAHDMSPEQYRAKWGLPADYPMVAPNYAKSRSDLAKATGLGQQRKKAAEPAAPAKRVGRPRKVVSAAE